MATIINNPSTTAEKSSGFGFMTAIILLVVVLLLLVFGSRMLSSITSPQVTVPDEVDVNIQPQTQGGEQ